jgi:hypothetical protein
MEPGPLGRLLRQRLDRDFPLPAVAQIHRASRGNPFYAIEIGRSLPADGPSSSPSEPFTEERVEHGGGWYGIASRRAKLFLCPTGTPPCGRPARALAAARLVIDVDIAATVDQAGCSRPPPSLPPLPADRGGGGSSSMSTGCRKTLQRRYERRCPCRTDPSRGFSPRNLSPRRPLLMSGGSMRLSGPWNVQPDLREGGFSARAPGGSFDSKGVGAMHSAPASPVGPSHAASGGTGGERRGA